MLVDKSIVQPQLGHQDSSEPITYTAFEPTFTYPIFGEQEVVFGYKGLSIKVRPFFIVSLL